MAKPRVIDIRGIYNIRCERPHYETGEFVLIFDADSNNGAKKEVRLRMKNWWVRFIAETLWKIVRYQQADVDENICALEGN